LNLMYVPKFCPLSQNSSATELTQTPVLVPLLARIRRSLISHPSPHSVHRHGLVTTVCDIRPMVESGVF